MNDTIKIVCSIGFGLYSAIIGHLYLILGTRIRNIGSTSGLLLYFTFVALMLGAPLIGVFALNGVFDHDRQKPTPHENHILIFTLICWLGTYFIYNIMNRRKLRELKQVIKDTQ